MGKLTTRAAATTKPGRYGDGDGLYLVVSATGASKWVFRYSWRGKVTEAGLGSRDLVGLAEARAKALEARKMVAEGKSPSLERKAAREAFLNRPTFGQIADSLIAAKSAEWRNDKHTAQWTMTLGETYCASIRNLPVEEIDTEAVLGVLQPIWLEKPETASRLRGRIEAVLDAARAKGHIPRNEANPARWRGHLDKLLPKRQKLTRGHHAAMPYSEVPAFLARLRERDATAALALEFTILSAARSGEVRGARWSEFDLEKKIWTIPAERMKAQRAHRAPLSDRAAEIVKTLEKAKTCEFIFAGAKGDKPLSVMAMDMLLRRMDVDVTVHGFRSAFRDWAGNETQFAREVAEAALAHVIGDKAEQAYRRSDALEKRRSLMAAWAKYCDPGLASNVVSIGKAAQ
ncbi:integrase arm-type DNA-binding domain-containing protein [Rhodoblastus sp. 17X3]|uniref:tyrosine-type recombinase/integrase n=1 Tax=Rhodoblastus sp. 17X3 TaxID=3047026 RepID=UPI0024B83581|nr:site-specific integrase [Rhodoblastus sp. 17X3]MDI9848143.1 integrase arm-type DNA-binding domain-containing protein [Rhodoblastus sp. 17X3]